MKPQDPFLGPPLSPDDAVEQKPQEQEQGTRVRVEIEGPVGSPKLSASMECDEALVRAIQKLPRAREIDSRDMAAAARQAEARRNLLRSLSLSLADRLLTLVESQDQDVPGEPVEMTATHTDLGDALAMLILADSRLHDIIDQYPQGRRILSTLYSRHGGHYPRHEQAMEAVLQCLL